MLLRKELLPNKIVLSLHETIDNITQKNKLFIRIGDGELPILHKKSGGFHHYNPILEKKLLEAYYYALNNDDFLVGINPDLVYPFTSLQDKSLISSCYHYKILDFFSIFPLREYANAFALRVTPESLWNEQNDNQKNISGNQIFQYYKQSLIEKLKRKWANKHIIICEGEYSNFGVYNDLLEYAKSVDRIYGKNLNAFCEYDIILQNAQKIAKCYDKEQIFFIFALGHTSKILMVDLYQLGYKHSLDAGNLSISYDCAIYSLPYSYIDDPISCLAYPPLYYGHKLIKGKEKNNAKRF